MQQSFLHVAHRETYQISDEELKSMRFYVSTNVLMSDVPEGHFRGGAEGVALVRREQPGRVIEVGPDWLRVAFAEDAGIVFSTAGTEDDESYLLATEVPGRDGFYRLVDLPEPAILHGGRTHPIVYGADARLLVHAGDLRDLIRERGVGAR